jgi:hypothetical protein
MKKNQSLLKNNAKSLSKCRLDAFAITLLNQLTSLKIDIFEFLLCTYTSFVLKSFSLWHAFCKEVIFYYLDFLA